MNSLFSLKCAYPFEPKERAESSTTETYVKRRRMNVEDSQPWEMSLRAVWRRTDKWSVVDGEIVSFLSFPFGDLFWFYTCTRLDTDSERTSRPNGQTFFLLLHVEMGKRPRISQNAGIAIIIACRIPLSELATASAREKVLLLRASGANVGTRKQCSRTHDRKLRSRSL